MKDDLGRQAVRLIQSIIARDTGAPLSRMAEHEIEKLLRALQSGDKFPDTPFEHREVSILLADLRGFTAVSASQPAGVVIGMLNRCFTRMSEIVYRCQGTIDKFMGDSIMVLFGAPFARHDDVERALTCAVEMQIEMVRLNEQFRQEGRPELFMGIGINTGKVMLGKFGSEVYSEYTVIGDEVNLASRIEAFSLRGQVLISESTYQHADGFAEASDPMEVYVKGKATPVKLRELLAIPMRGLNIPRQDTRRSHRVEVKIDCTARRVENKIILPTPLAATILDIGYHGVLLQVAEPMPLHAELKLEFLLGLVEYLASDVYAKVVKVKADEDQYLLGLEFTSVNHEATQKIQLFVQLLVGSD